MNAKTKTPAHTKDPYLDLIINVHPLRPIRSAQQHQQEKEAMRSLGSDKRAVATEFKKVLVSIIETYEREAALQLDTSGVSAAELVRHLLAERQMSVEEGHPCSSRMAFRCASW
jgi:hypothetical protein